MGLQMVNSSGVLISLALSASTCVNDLRLLALQGWLPRYDYLFCPLSSRSMIVYAALGTYDLRPSRTIYRQKMKYLEIGF
jgi:hypothetical protein